MSAMNEQHPIERYIAAKDAVDQAVRCQVDEGQKLIRIGTALTRPPHYIAFNGKSLPLDVLSSGPSVAPEEFPTFASVSRIQDQLIAAEHDLARARHDLTPDQRRTLGI